MKKNAQQIIEIAREHAEKIHSCLVNRLDEIQWSEGYSEPGYGGVGGDPVVLLGNWNEPTPWCNDVSEETKKRIASFWAKVTAALEKVAELEWQDEWCTCQECGKAVRTSADSYSWTPYFTIFNGCELVCNDCVDPEEVFRFYEQDASRACSLDADPEDYGYVRVNEESFESGWHEGQTDNPKDIALSLERSGIDRFFFKIDGVGQFDTRFSVYVHESQKKMLEDIAA